MTTVRMRAPFQYQARVRRLQGSPPESQTFRTRQDALARRLKQEHLILQGTGASLRRACKLTLADALTRYSLEVTPHKKGAGPYDGRCHGKHRKNSQSNGWLVGKFCSLALAMEMLEKHCEKPCLQDRLPKFSLKRNVHEIRLNFFEVGRFKTHYSVGDSCDLHTKLA
jgi:hypothetical protein